MMLMVAPLGVEGEDLDTTAGWSEEKSPRSGLSSHSSLETAQSNFSETAVDLGRDLGRELLEPDDENFARYLSTPSARYYARNNRRKATLPASALISSSPLSSENAPADVEMLTTPSGRREWTRRQIEDRRAEYLNQLDVKVLSTTWNVCAASRELELDWLKEAAKQADVVAVALQEVQLLAGYSAVSTDPLRGKAWAKYLTTALAEVGEFDILCQRQMVGIVLCVFVRSELRPAVREVSDCEVGTGLMGRVGNKGAVAMRFRLHESTFCFISCHFAAQQDSLARRNQDYREVMRRAMFTENVNGETKDLLDHDLVIWMGDLNYRIDLDSADVLAAIHSRDWDKLLAHEQLSLARSSDPQLFENFHELELNFAPTYKVLKGKDGYVEKKPGVPSRPPSWTDRILYRTRQREEREVPVLDRSPSEFEVECSDYRRHEAYGSDHRPVSAMFHAKVIELNEFSRSRVLSDVHGQLLPEIELTPRKLWFPRVFRGTESEATFVICNSGRVPVNLSIQTDAQYYTVARSSCSLGAGDEVFVNVKLGVTAEQESELMAGRDRASVLDIVSVEHQIAVEVEHGPTLRLPVSFEYVYSILGRTLEELSGLYESPEAPVPLPVVRLCRALEKLGLPKDNDGMSRCYRVHTVVEAVSRGEQVPNDVGFSDVLQCLVDLLYNSELRSLTGPALMGTSGDEGLSREAVKSLERIRRTLNKLRKGGASAVGVDALLERAIERCDVALKSNKQTELIPAEDNISAETDLESTSAVYEADSHSP